jgi:hypothetical protein
MFVFDFLLYIEIDKITLQPHPLCTPEKAQNAQKIDCSKAKFSKLK